MERGPSGLGNGPSGLGNGQQGNGQQGNLNLRRHEPDPKPDRAWCREAHELKGLHKPACAGAASPQRRLRAGLPDSRGPGCVPAVSGCTRSRFQTLVQANILHISTSSSDWCGRNPTNWKVCTGRPARVLHHHPNGDYVLLGCRIYGALCAVPVGPSPSDRVCNPMF